MLQVDTVIIGAGVVGLAVARHIARMGKDVTVLEEERYIGSHTSSRNSGVIHAGIYYPPHSHKAIHCIRGKERLIRFCEDYHVEYRTHGKLIVATNSNQINTLKHIQKNAIASGVQNLDLKEQHELSLLEPQLNAVAALYSPSTSVIDTHGLLLALQGDIEKYGGNIVLNSTIKAGAVSQSGNHYLHINSDNQEYTVEAKHVVNCAGLFAVPLLKTIKHFPAQHIPKSYYAKGSYFSLAGASPFKHLIYPVPEQAGLGIHLTLDLIGKARFGPDIEWLKEQQTCRPDYHVDSKRSELFYNAIRQYWPKLPEGSLSPDYAGIRPKLQSPNGNFSDFLLQGPEIHGIPRWVNLLGIESPGLTACLSLAEATVDLLIQ